MPRILILNGPNLNMLGVREPEIYGTQTLVDIENLCRAKAKELGHEIDFRQSNHEGELVDWIQKARGAYGGIIINAAAYTHTSVAIHDALKIFGGPVVEVHLSDPQTRDPFRHHSYITPLAAAVIAGKGPAGYEEALAFFRRTPSQ
ncbi:MAG: type II 3-dehydroquinate dehydratase [Proteobacteria bacterium]|nr:type II 3-dehydroquinate dehydratase [Pseudomonadota bacterium]